MKIIESIECNENIVYISLCLIFLTIVGIIIKISKNKKRKRHARRQRSPLYFGDQKYQQEILDSLPTDTRLDFSHLYRRLSDLQRQIETTNKNLTYQEYNARESIRQKIRESQDQIDKKWAYIQLKREFYYYIGIHYASFTLADSIKREQEIIRNAFVLYKKECDRIGETIESLNNQIKKAHGPKRYELMQKHQALCKQHKRISQMKNIFGKRNAEYLDMVKNQNRKTEHYRDYIIGKFGAKGRSWGNRLKKRKADMIR